MELPTHVDPKYIARVVRTLCAEGDVIEARVLGVRQAGHISGYFDDFDRLATAVARYDGRAEATYLTLNPVQPALLARACNRLAEWAKHTTGDMDILCRHWMLIDFDPARPAGISSSDAELETALARREQVIEWLDLAGFPSGLCGMSGNGAHLLYRLDNLPNDEEHTTLVQSCINVLAARFGDKAVDIDRKVYNAARLCKLYGTFARKGENMPDRPHRRSCLDIPNTLPDPLSLEQLRWLARQAQEPSRVSVPRTASQITAGRRLDVPAYLAAAGLVEGRDYRTKHKKGTTWYNLRICPVHADANPNFECGICQSDDGALGAKCQHDSNKTWRDFKAALGDPVRFYIGNGATPPSQPVVSVSSTEDSIPAQTPSANLLARREIELEEVLAFARCPTEHLWRYGARVDPPLNSGSLVQEVTRTGLFRFYTSHSPSPLAGIQSRWRERLETWGTGQAFETLDAYARARADILVLFLTGQISQPNGETYRAPRATEAYCDLYEQRGLLGLRAEIDDLAKNVPIILGDDESLADLFADTVEIALRWKKPLPSEIIGVEEPFQVPLSNGCTLIGHADLAIPDKDKGAILEVWDWSSVPFDWTVWRRNLRVAATLRAQSDKWPDGVECVRVRYVHGGETVRVFGRNAPPWMETLLIAACQATRSETELGAPRLAISAQQCKGCPYWKECTSEDGWNILGTAKA